MGDDDELPSPDADRVVERGDQYEHDRYGTVEVMGIWKGIEGVDSTGEAKEKDVYIVRYTTDEDGEQVDELTDTLNEFLDAIE
jgi:hypothetical protein